MDAAPAGDAGDQVVVGGVASRGLERRRVMRASLTIRAVLAAAMVCAASGGAAHARHRTVDPKVGGDREPVLVVDQPFDLASTPLYEVASMANPSAVGDDRQIEPVLVPLPPGAWAAMSGLVGLAAVAAWRKYRFRHE